MDIHDEIKKILIDEKKTFKWLGESLGVDASNLSRQIKRGQVTYDRLSKVLSLLGRHVKIEKDAS